LTGIFDLNVRGTLFTVQKALPLFRDGGSILLNGSIADQKGMPGLSVYGGSKAALRAFARSWLMDLKERRIRVNVLSPGPIDTPAMQKAPEASRAQFKSIIPWGEFGTSEEIATVALFLACNDSKFVNGTELCVDGGTRRSSDVGDQHNLENQRLRECRLSLRGARESIVFTRNPTMQRGVRLYPNAQVKVKCLASPLILLCIFSSLHTYTRRRSGGNCMVRRQIASTIFVVKCFGSAQMYPACLWS